MPDSLTSLTLGTRGSELALAQADMTTLALRAAHPALDVRREIVRTSGDLRPDLRLVDFSKGENPVLDKGIFTRELELALRAGTIDAAVHSLKDVPTVLDDGFCISAVLPRANDGDVLVSRTAGGLDALRAGSVVATSSVRRARQLVFLRADLTTVEIRGNVPTRLRKLAENPEIDALLLAQAGLERLALFRAESEVAGTRLHMSVLNPDVFLPAAGQGAVALETFRESAALRDTLAAIGHVPTFRRVAAERRFLALLNAGCTTPVGVRSVLEAGSIRLNAIVFPDDGGPPLHAAVTHPEADPEGAAAQLFASLETIQG